MNFFLDTAAGKEHRDTGKGGKDDCRTKIAHFLVISAPEARNGKEQD